MDRSSDGKKKISPIQTTYVSLLATLRTRQVLKGNSNGPGRNVVELYYQALTNKYLLRFQWNILTFYHLLQDVLRSSKEIDIRFRIESTATSPREIMNNIYPILEKIYNKYS